MKVIHHKYWNIWEVVYYTPQGLLMPVRKFDTQAQAEAFIANHEEK